MRRLRENTMLEAEISPAGDVTVEGHHVGQLQGFRFTADTSAEGEDAKAVKGAAQKALGQEFDARAERFAATANGDLALSSDGILRWLGSPIAMLAAGDHVLRPRVILLADEQLTGPSRDKVAARAERFVAYQVESLLKPLQDLAAGDGLEGIAKGIAFRMAEQMGVINRREIADEVKALDQDTRAGLRKLGVRFGAYHLFVPALLKPAPAGLITTLWALFHDARDEPGFGDVVAALAAGRTSVVTDPAYKADFYRLAGFRVLGRRAVRVDILERLADLIRPAVSWQPGQGNRPEGGYDGRAFVVTPAMMSILGATPDDMDEILRALGYRGETKPAEEVEAHLAALDAAGKAEAAAAPADETGNTDAAVDVDTASAQTPGTDDAGAGVAEASPQPAGEAPDAAPEARESGADVAAEQTPDQAASANPEPEAPRTITVWRQGRPEGRGRPQAPRGRENQPKRDGFKGRGRDQNRGPKPAGKGHGKPERPQGGKPQREVKPQRIDPDSPFAKLAALKDKMGK